MSSAIERSTKSERVQEAFMRWQAAKSLVVSIAHELMEGRYVLSDLRAALKAERSSYQEWETALGWKEFVAEIKADMEARGLWPVKPMDVGLIRADGKAA